MSLECEKIFRHGTISSNIYSFTQLNGISSSSFVDFSTRVTWCVTNLSPRDTQPTLSDNWKPRWERALYGCQSSCRSTPKTFSPILLYQQDGAHHQLKISDFAACRNSINPTSELRQRLLLSYGYFQGPDLYYNSPTDKQRQSSITPSADYCEDLVANQVKTRFCETKNKKYKCQYCDVTCTNNGQLKGHLRVHTGEKPYKCDYMNCGRSFARNEELTRHRRIHSGIRPHQCVRCGKFFGRKDHLNKHMKTHLKTAEKKNYTCKVGTCEQRYTRSDALARHQWSIHGIKPKTAKWKRDALLSFKS